MIDGAEVELPLIAHDTGNALVVVPRCGDCAADVAPVVFR